MLLPSGLLQSASTSQGCCYARGNSSDRKAHHIVSSVMLVLLLLCQQILRRFHQNLFCAHQRYAFRALLCLCEQIATCGQLSLSYAFRQRKQEIYLKGRFWCVYRDDHKKGQHLFPIFECLLFHHTKIDQNFQ